MPDIKELLPKLSDEIESERDMFSAKRPREYFIELMGVEGTEELLEKYTPDVHNEKWDAERQKPAPDLDVIMKNRRAIAFMSAGKLGVYRHYAENELSARIMGRARMNWNENCLKQTEYFTQMDSIKKG